MAAMENIKTSVGQSTGYALIFPLLPDLYCLFQRAKFCCGWGDVIDL
jgi:hypothetical protein